MPGLAVSAMAAAGSADCDKFFRDALAGTATQAGNTQAPSSLHRASFATLPVGLK